MQNTPKFELEYNSQRESMMIPEYGRNVQKLVDYAKTMTEKDERQEFVEQIIALMNIMIPSNKSLADNQQKMWNHLFKIANYELDVEVPQGIEIHKEDKESKEKHDLQYPTASYRFRHYGAYIQKMIAKAKAMEDEDKKEGYAEAIASYMKLAYQTWNREHYVNDEVIKQDLEAISKGDLKFDEEYSIENLVSIKHLKNQRSRNKKAPKKNKRRKN